MSHIGLNAHLLARGGDYRNAGVSRYIHNLLVHLPKADADLTYTAFVGEREKSYPGWTMEASWLSTDEPLLRVLWEQLGQPWAARRAKLDLLHAPVYVSPALHSGPTVVTVHDLSFFLHPDLFRRPHRAYLQACTRRSVEKADAVIAVSESTRSDVIEVLGTPATKVTTVHNGVDSDMRPLSRDEVNAYRRRHALPSQMMLFLATLEPRKNLPTLLEAYATMRQKHNSRHHLVVAGGRGWYYQEIYATVERLGLREDVTFLGFVPREELALLYNAAELFVYPSLYEGFGFPPLEAMACGTPVVVSNTSSLPEVVGDAGVSVDPYDADALASAILKVLSDASLRDRLRHAGLANAARFSWEKTASATVQVYRRVLEESNGRSS